jgi:hypothetical protein
MKLSFPSKMPCASVGLPAIVACITGAKLAQVPGSVCTDCYAMKGNYRFNNVKAPRDANLTETRKALKTAKGRNAWVSHMVQLIKGTSMMYFRWHDSGDILSADHLSMICDVAEQTPDVKHWLPTREYKFVQTVAFDRGIPANLNVRLSAHMVGRTLEPTGGFTTSSVEAGTGWQCPATHNPAHAGKCLDCRACWDRGVGNVDYSKH